MSDRINNSIPIVERPELAGQLMAPLRECGARVYGMNGCRIICANEPDGWHISISRKDRDPSWEEIVTVRYRLLPEIDEMAMYLPRLEDYVNIQKYCFHLHEVKKSRILLA